MIDANDVKAASVRLYQVLAVLEEGLASAEKLLREGEPMPVKRARAAGRAARKRNIELGMLKE